jgi:hypothetical protein
MANVLKWLDCIKFCAETPKDGYGNVQNALVCIWRGNPSSSKTFAGFTFHQWHTLREQSFVLVTDD